MGHAGADSRLCEAGEEGGDDGWDEDTLGVKLTVEKDLALDDIAGDV